jgi:hypothetical protein
VAALLVLGSLLAELGMRALMRTGRLPEAPSPSTETDVSLANVQRAGRPDVLIVGTSAIRSALRPSVLEGLIREHTGAPVKVQNVAQPALSLEGHRILVDGLARRGLVPGLVILGLTPSTMTGYGAAGDAFSTSELGRLWGRCRLQRESSLACGLSRWSALWRWRSQGRRLRASLVEGLPWTVGDRHRRLTSSGWLSERPVRGYTLEQRVPQLLDVLPAGVPLPAANLASFVALVRELRGQGATVVAVALPYAPQLETALVERNPAWAAERAAGYAALSAAAALPIAIIEGYGAWWQPESQNDLRHLSRRGAGPLTQQLWERPDVREPILAALAAGARAQASAG